MGPLLLFPLCSWEQNLGLICFNQYCLNMVVWGYRDTLISVWLVGLVPFSHLGCHSHAVRVQSGSLRVGRQRLLLLYVWSQLDDVNLCGKNSVQPFRTWRVRVSQKIIWGGGPTVGRVPWESQCNAQELHRLFCSANEACAGLSQIEQHLSGNQTSVRRCVVSETEWGTLAFWTHKEVGSCFGQLRS